MTVFISHRLRFPTVLLSLFCILSVVGGCARSETSQAERNTQRAREMIPTPEPRWRVVVLGDSIAAGLGLAEDRAFPAVLERLLIERGLATEVVNAGVSGDTTAGGVSRVDWVLQGEPDVLVVELGGNDALRGQPIENIEGNLREIIRRGREAGVPVLLLGMDVPTNYGPDYTTAFSAIYENLAGEEGVTLVPGFIREVGLDEALMQADGIHPTAGGQRRLAERLVPFVAQALDGATR